MKARVQWLDGRAFVGESGSGHAVVDQISYPVAPSTACQSKATPEGALCPVAVSRPPWTG